MGVAIEVGDGALAGEAGTVRRATAALGGSLAHVSACREEVSVFAVTALLPGAAERLVGSLEEMLRQARGTADLVARLLVAGGGTYDAAEMVAAG